ncbi:MAG: transposase [Gemmatimonadales bacterium]
MTGKRKEYPLELKRRVVARVESGELEIGVVAREYGLRPDQVRRWLEQFGSADGTGSKQGRRTKKGKGEVAALEAEVKRLRWELEKAEAERDFLKKAASYFARATP